MPVNPHPIEPLPPRKQQELPQPCFTLSAPQYGFEDIVLPDEVRNQINEVLALYTYQHRIFVEWGLETVLHQQGKISVNLYGESGTGKTMCAHAIARKLNKKILSVNYAEIESKYVGETSKNIVSLFRCARENDAVLLFDEADALLSRRVTDMSSAADVSVNQTRNVLLKLLDEYKGIVIFTTNFIRNFDPAFFRRILTHIYFDLPEQPVRARIWSHYLTPGLPLAGDRDVMIERLSRTAYTSGADIANCVLKTALHAAASQKDSLSCEDFDGVLRNILQAKKAMNNESLSFATRQIPAAEAKAQLEGRCL